MTVVLLVVSGVPWQLTGVSSVSGWREVCVKWKEGCSRLSHECEHNPTGSALRLDLILT